MSTGTTSFICCCCCCCSDSPAPLVIVVIDCQLSRLKKSVTTTELTHKSYTVRSIRWAQQLNRCFTECGAAPHSGQISDMPVTMRALYTFKSRQRPERNWVSVVWTDLCSSGETSQISSSKNCQGECKGQCNSLWCSGGWFSMSACSGNSVQQCRKS